MMALTALPLCALFVAPARRNGRLLFFAFGNLGRDLGGLHGAHAPRARLVLALALLVALALRRVLGRLAGQLETELLDDHANARGDGKREKRAEDPHEL